MYRKTKRIDSFYRPYVLLFLLLALFLSGGCAAENQKENEADVLPDTSADTLNDTSVNPPDNNAVCRQKYKECLINLTENHIFPDGSPIDVAFIEDNDFSGNDFAVCDIDSDGVEELLISYSDASMAGMVFYIFQYDTGADTFRQEFWSFPGVTFYENGYITSDLSHNQGLAGEFWPYSIYRYNADSDVYDAVAFVDAWDKNTYPEDFNGNAFPDDIDKSGSGYVYYIHKGGMYQEETAPSDVTEYNKLVDETYGRLSEVTIDYLPITEDNIAKI